MSGRRDPVGVRVESSAYCMSGFEIRDLAQNIRITTGRNSFTVKIRWPYPANEGHHSFRHLDGNPHFLNRVKKDRIYPFGENNYCKGKIRKPAGRSGKSWHLYEVSDGHHR